ncbi:MAG TPA: PDZ domain-containing protein, partial [Candidatus Binatia bacterium]|nr:PDZ domain-containing protein [Candidatus Binatia bacterium]
TSDVITAVDGHPVATPQQLRSEIRGKKPGQPVTLSVFRKDKTIQVKLSPAEWPEPNLSIAKVKNTPSSSGTEAKSIGVTVQVLTSELAGKFGVGDTEGVIITSVEKNSLAARNGLKPGDVITSLDQQEVTTPKQFNEVLKKADLKTGLLVNLISGNTARFEILKSGE